MCRVYDDAVKSGQPPHIIFDTTKSGLAADTVKSFSNQLAIPTISASYGQSGDLRQWRDISAQQKDFLLQVRIVCVCFFFFPNCYSFPKGYASK